jgi:protease I
MHHVDLTGLRVAVLAADGAEQVEITSPVDALEDHGADVEIVSLRPGRLRTVNFLYPGKKVRVHRTLRTADAEDYDALLLPGGLISPDTLRQSEEALDFVRGFDRAGKPIAVICHGPWLLVSAGLVVRRNLTCWPGIRDDVRNAGAIYHDEPMVRDRNWVSSRGPHALRHFNRGMLELFAEHMPVAPSAPEYAETRPRPRPRRERNIPIGRILAGGGLAAGLAYLVTQQLQREGEMEYVEVVDLEPATVDVRTEAAYDEYDEFDEDATLTGGYAGGMPYREGGPEYTAGTTGYLGSDGEGYDTGAVSTGTAGTVGGDYAGTDLRGGTGTGAGTPGGTGGYGSTGTGTGGGAYGTGTGGTGGYGATGTGTAGYGSAGTGGFGDSGGSATNPPA